MKQIYKRMLIGAGIGFFSLFATTFALIYMNGWFDASVHSYAGPPPLMTVLIFGLFGFVCGAIIGVLNVKRPYNGILVIVLLGGVLPSLPSVLFDYFPEWTKIVLIILGLITIVLSLVPWQYSDKNRSTTHKKNIT